MAEAMMEPALDDEDYGTPEEPEENAGADESLLRAIDNAEAAAYGSDGNSDLNTQRASSISDYLGDPYGDEREGRSQVISRDVYETIEWIKPSLVRIFTAGDEVARFDPVSEEDTQGAEQESDYINHVVMHRNPWFPICNEWFGDALLTKNAYVLAYWDRSTAPEHEQWMKQTIEEAYVLVSDPDVTVLDVKEKPDRDWMPPDPSTLYDPRTGQELPTPERPMLYDIKLNRVRRSDRVKMCVLPPERCKVAEDTAGMSVKDANYFEYWEMVSISKLREMGYDVPDDIEDEGEEDTEEDEARDQHDEDQSRETDNAEDPSMRKVRMRMVWIRFDHDGDGHAEMRHVVRVGQTILYNDYCSQVHVASIVPTPLPHRHPGLSVRDLVTDLQKIKTALWRGTLDNIYLANNGRYGISDKVKAEDFLTSRPGGVVRVKGGIPAEHIFPFTHPFIAGQTLQVMDYVDKARNSRTGTSEAFTGVDPDVLNQSPGVAISKLNMQAQQKVEHIARIFAEGVKELCLIVHELCLRYGHKTEIVKLKGKFTPVQPSKFKRRDDMTIAVGLGTGAKDFLLQTLMMIGQQQKEGLPIGLCKPKHIYHTAVEFVKAAGFPNPDSFWQDPGDAELPQQQSDANIYAQTEMQKQQMKEAGDTERKRLELESEERIAREKLEHERWLAEFKAGHERGMQDNQLMEGRVERHESAESAKLERDVDEDSLLAVVENRMGQLIEQQSADIRDALKDILSAARATHGEEEEIVRDEQGRAVGKRVKNETGDPLYEEIIIRDQQGRATGKRRVQPGTLH